MNDIQKARDVLKKWADSITPRPWAIEEIPETGECRIVIVDEDLDAPTIITVTSGGMTRADASLIVGTAGNPDLLDAIDELLALAQQVASDHRAGWPAVIWQYAEPIAATIVAADERIQQ